MNKLYPSATERLSAGSSYSRNGRGPLLRSSIAGGKQDVAGFDIFRTGAHHSLTKPCYAAEPGAAFGCFAETLDEEGAAKAMQERKVLQPIRPPAGYSEHEAAPYRYDELMAEMAIALSRLTERTHDVG